MTDTQRITTPQELRALVKQWRAEGLCVGFVPTMGALHDGHIRLGIAARAQCDRVIYSIFVNPLQFAPHEDFGRYPRTVDADVTRLAAAGVDAVYLPSEDVMYPEPFLTVVTVAGVTAPLEGEFRPLFFTGVATVVTKLLLQVLPDKAFFGEKDYQQLQVIKTLTHDLDLPVEIVGVPTVRDEHGLALSSRNVYLSEDQMATARRINEILLRMGEKLRSGERMHDIEQDAKAELLQAGVNKIDYCTFRDAVSLASPAEDADPDSLRVLVAVWLGGTRLIDNMAV